MPAASAIDVACITDAGGHVGIRIQGGFIHAAGGIPSDTVLSYNVSVVGTSNRITDARLAGDPAVVGGAAC